MRPSCLLASWLLVSPMMHLPVFALAAPPHERGVALGLFSEDPHYDYLALLDEIRELGATHVSIVWVWWQDDLRATRIAPKPAWSATDAQIVRTMEAARSLGLHVTAFPILRLEKSAKDEWRGRIQPTDENLWWDSYRKFIDHAVMLALRSGAERICVGSELLSREGMRIRWIDLIDRIRVSAPKLEIMYSANWDHYRPVSFWDAVDVVGISAYFELTKDVDAKASDLANSWGGVKQTLEQWSGQLGRPIVISEVGYPSLDGAAAWPWDETREAPVDLVEQARAYEAFVHAWSDTPFLQGAYWWNWFGHGGAEDKNYTPRNKPAARVIKAWYRP